MTVFLLTMSRGLAIGGVLQSSLSEGDAYSGTLVGYGGVEPYSWFISSGALPDGVTATTDSDGQFVFSGTTTADGEFSFVVTLQDAEGRSVTKAFQITVLDIPATLNVSGAFTDTEVGSPLNGSPLTITGGTAPYGLSGSPYSGTRPAGVTISVSGSDLVATGNTTTSASYSWTERVTSSDAQHFDVVCSIDVTPGPDIRITETGDTRITESSDTRITE